MWRCFVIETQTRNWRDQKTVTTPCTEPTVRRKHYLCIHLYHMIHSTRANRKVCYVFRFLCANFCLYRNWLPTIIFHGLLGIPALEVYITIRQISFLVNIDCHHIHYFHSRRAVVNQQNLGPSWYLAGLSINFSVKIKILCPLASFELKCTTQHREWA
jgi:hypothetical protein